MQAAIGQRVPASPPRGGDDGLSCAYFFFAAPAFGLHMAPGITRLDW